MENMSIIETKIHLNNHYEFIKNIFMTEKLISLEDNKFIYKDVNFLHILNFRKEDSKFEKFDIFKIKSDLLNCNNDLKLFTANLYLYQPFINNPFKEFKIRKTEKKFKYFQKMEDWIYSSNVSCCFEKSYNFWDRIGDTLAYSLELDIKEHLVGFAKVIKKIESLGTFNDNENFIFLNNFKKNEFKELNKQRKEIVHYYQFETTYKEKFHSVNSSESDLKKLWEWKKNMPNYFKEQLELSCEGFYNMYKLIEFSK